MLRQHVLDHAPVLVVLDNVEDNLKRLPGRARPVYRGLARNELKVN